MAYACAWLIPLQNPDGARHKVPPSGLQIGRKEGCGLQLPCPTISAVQCQISYKAAAGVFELEDQSSNGTYLNGKVLKRGQCLPLSEGDEIQMTKRWQSNRSLQFRFSLREAGPSLLAPPAAAPSAAAPPAAAPAAAQAATGPAAAPLSAVALDRAPVARPPSEGPFAAAEELVREAERTGLAAQRGVLQGELAGGLAARERLRQELTAVDATLATAVDERARLEATLHEALTGLARLRGQREALHIGLEEAVREADSAAEALGPTSALEAGLEAALAAAAAEAEAARAAAGALARRAEAKESSVEALRRLGRELAEELRGRANALAISVRGGAARGEELGAQGMAVQDDPVPASPVPTQRVLTPDRGSNLPPTLCMDEAPVPRPALAEAPLLRDAQSPALQTSQKENVMPTSWGQDLRCGRGEAPERPGLRKRPRLWGPILGQDGLESAHLVRRSASGAILIEDVGS